MNNINIDDIRQDDELAKCVSEWGWKYHHIGIPTTMTFPDEKYLPSFKIYVSGFSESPFGIEWMRYETGCPIHPLIQQVAHIAFEVDNIDYELQKHQFNVIEQPGSPSEGVRAAMIEYNGAPIELISFKRMK